MNSDSSVRHWITVTIAAAILSGCTVGRDYTAPQVKVEPEFEELHQTTSADPAPQASRAVNQSIAVIEWWRAFGDPELDRLIDEAFRENYGLQIATVRLLQARAQRRVIAAKLLPGIDADAGYIRSLGSRNVVLPFGGGGASGGAGGSAGKSPSGSSTRRVITPSADPSSERNQTL